MENLELTKEETDILEAMLEVIVEGGGVYMLLREPSIAAAHQRIFRKLRALRNAR